MLFKDSHCLDGLSAALQPGSTEDAFWNSLVLKELQDEWTESFFATWTLSTLFLSKRESAEPESQAEVSGFPFIP